MVSEISALFSNHSETKRLGRGLFHSPYEFSQISITHYEALKDIIINSNCLCQGLLKINFLTAPNWQYQSASEESNLTTFT